MSEDFWSKDVTNCYSSHSSRHFRAAAQELELMDYDEDEDEDEGGAAGYEIIYFPTTTWT